MSGKQWVEFFVKSLKKLEPESNTKTDAEWTEFMIKVMKAIGEKADCYVVSRASKDRKYSGEYLNMDAMFIDNSDYTDWDSDDWDPPVLPSAVVELENDDRFAKITYCLWKIICIRAEIRVLICYQTNKDKVNSLRKRLEETLMSRRLMETAKGELFVIIGDATKDDSSWKDYFNIFEWRNERLEYI